MPQMTSRERMLCAMQNQQPDRVPAAPDISNMIPCRLTGKPFWDIYLYQDPPLWRAYMEAVRHFGMDGWLYSLDGFYVPDPVVPLPSPAADRQETVMVDETAERIVTRSYTERKGKAREWSRHVTVYPRADPPTTLLAHKIGMEASPSTWRPIEGVKPQKQGFALLQEALDCFADRGVIGAGVWAPILLNRRTPSRGMLYDGRESRISERGGYARRRRYARMT